MNESSDIFWMVLPIIIASSQQNDKVDCFDNPPSPNVIIEQTVSDNRRYKIKAEHCVVNLLDTEYRSINVASLAPLYSAFWTEKGNRVTLNSTYYSDNITNYWKVEDHKWWACVHVHENLHAKEQTGANECRARNLQYKCLQELNAEDYVLNHMRDLLCRSDRSAAVHFNPPPQVVNYE